MGQQKPNIDEAKGRVKKAAGELTDDQDLINEGRNDQLAGKAKSAMDTVKDHFDDAVDKARDAVNGD